MTQHLGTGAGTDHTQEKGLQFLKYTVVILRVCLKEILTRPGHRISLESTLHGDAFLIPSLPPQRLLSGLPAVR